MTVLEARTARLADPAGAGRSGPSEPSGLRPLLRAVADVAEGRFVCCAKLRAAELVWSMSAAASPDAGVAIELDPDLRARLVRLPPGRLRAVRGRPGARKLCAYTVPLSASCRLAILIGGHAAGRAAAMEAACALLAYGLRLRERCGRQEVRAAAFAMAPDAQFVLDRSLRMLGANRRAEAMLDGRLLVERSGRLLARDGALRRALDRAARAPVGFETELGCGGGDRPLEARITVARLFGGQEIVHLVLRTARARQWSERELMDAFDLTRREAETTLALCRGLKPAEIATRLQIGQDSVRTYLKRVFSKTGTEGQIALVAKLLRRDPLPPAGAPGSPGSYSVRDVPIRG